MIGVSLALVSSAAGDQRRDYRYLVGNPIPYRSHLRWG